MTLVKIYRNDGKDHFFGFVNEFANAPALTMVYEFEFDETYLAGHFRPGCPSVDDILNWIYAETNDSDGKLVPIFQERELRSVSTGDVVTIGESAWSCEDIGWRPVSTEQLVTAIERA